MSNQLLQVFYFVRLMCVFNKQSHRVFSTVYLLYVFIHSSFAGSMYLVPDIHAPVLSYMRQCCHICAINVYSGVLTYMHIQQYMHRFLTYVYALVWLNFFVFT